MRYLMFTHNDGRAEEVLCYRDDELGEVFGDRLPALDANGFCQSPNGIWVDMQRAARKRTAQIKMAKDSV